MTLKLMVGEKFAFKNNYIIYGLQGPYIKKIFYRMKNIGKYIPR